MSGLWHVARHDLRLYLAERANIFFLLVMPLGFTLFFGIIGGGGGSSGVQVSLPVVDLDRSPLSQAFVQQLEGESFAVELHDHPDSLDAPPRWVQIPAGFQDSVLAGHQVAVQLNKSAGSNLSYDLAADIRVQEARARFVGNLVRWGEVGQPANDSPVALGRLMALVGEAPRITATSRHAGEGRPVPQGFGQSVPGMLAMFIVMTVLITGSEALTKEKEEGTLRRLAGTPLARWQVLGGKLLGLAFLGMVQAAILIGLVELLGSFGVLGMEPVYRAHLPGLFVLLLPYCAAVAAIGLLLGAVFRSNQQAESFAWLVGLVFAALGGCWWPLEIVPAWAQALGHVFPTAWAMDGLHSLLSFGRGPVAVLQPAAVLLLFTLGAATLGSRLLRYES